jgi:hypothetical protein
MTMTWAIEVPQSGGAEPTLFGFDGEIAARYIRRPERLQRREKAET